METPNVKLLKKLADACRKAGIKSFKGYGFEFTLDELVPSAKKQAKVVEEPAKPAADNGPEIPFETDSLTNEELLFWSVGLTSQATGDPEENAS